MARGVCFRYCYRLNCNSTAGQRSENLSAKVSPMRGGRVAPALSTGKSGYFESWLKTSRNIWSKDFASPLFLTPVKAFSAAGR